MRISDWSSDVCSSDLLHTLFWIGKFIHRVRTVPELVDAGLLTTRELRQFARAENFLLAVRCHLHTLAGRAEDRLTFDFQREIAQRMQFAERPGKSAVERFMQLYFLHAKSVDRKSTRLNSSH